MKRARVGLPTQHVKETSGKQAAAAVAKAPTDAVESANNLADRDHKSSSAPWLGTAGKGLGLLIDPSADRVADIAKSETLKHAKSSNDGM